MNSVHYDVIIYTSNIEKGVKKVYELIQDNNEEMFKTIPNVKYITDKRTYAIIDPRINAKGLRYYQAYIDKETPMKVIEYYIYPYCLPITDNWKERIHTF